jgi:phi13 family phage major tail protein
MTTENKIKYGLKNVHYAVLTDTVDAATGAHAYTYGTPVAWPGAVDLSLDPQGDLYKFFADNIAYYKRSNNTGYEGDLESARVPDSFKTDVLGETLDAKKVAFEGAAVEGKRFAFLFEFAGDVNATRFALYDCVATRPSLASKTVEDKMEAQTDKVTISASPLADEAETVLGHTVAETDPEVYSSWYTAVHQAAATA